MNLVLDDAVEIKQASKTEQESRRELGRRCAGVVTAVLLTARAGQILLKGDNVSLIQSLQG